MNERHGGIALLLGVVGGMTTMILHPVGHGAMTPDAVAQTARLSALAHSIALATVPLQAFGALALARRLNLCTSAILGALSWMFALVAMMLATAMSGFVAGDVLRLAASTAQPEWPLFLRYGYAINQAFSRIYVVGASAAMVLWSVAIVRTRAMPLALAVLGLIDGAVVALAVMSGHLRLNVHGMFVAAVLQGLWVAIAGVVLTRGRA